MKLNSAEYLINILKKNFNEIILNESFLKLGLKERPSLELNELDVFNFVIFTGALYLYRKYGLILRDSIQFYTGINIYEIEPKLFKSTKNGSLELNIYSKMIDFYQIKNELLKPKKILFYEYKGLSNFEHKVFEELIRINEDPKNYILFKINIENPKELEGFFEFIVHLYFNKIGFFTRNLVPFGYGGRPDFLAVDHEIFQILINYNLIKDPCSLFDLTLLSSIDKPIKKSFNCQKPSGRYEINIGEVKINPRYDTNSRLRDYLEKNKNLIYIHNIFEINPLKLENLKYGLFNIAKDFKITYEYKHHNFKYENEEFLVKQNKLWFEDNIKGLLLYNIPWQKIKSNLKNFRDYHQYIRSYKIETLCEEIINSKANNIQ